MIHSFEQFVLNSLNENESCFLAVSSTDSDNKWNLYGAHDPFHKSNGRFEFDVIEIFDDTKISIEELEQKVKSEYCLENGYGLVSLRNERNLLYDITKDSFILYDLEYTTWSNESNSFCINTFEQKKWVQTLKKSKTFKNYHNSLFKQRYVGVIKIDEFKKLGNKVLQ